MYGRGLVGKIGLNLSRQLETSQANLVTHQAAPILALYSVFVFLTDRRTDTMFKPDDHLFGHGLVDQYSQQ